MKVKKYRAETLREALEQIKTELGEDALILNTKKVQSSGLFGIGAKDQIEVTVTADTEAVQATIKATQDTRRKETGKKLNLTDGEAATPSVEKETPTVLKGLPFLSALAARSKSSEPNDFSTVVSPKLTAPKSEPETVEIAQTAPRIVHKPRPKPVVQQQQPAVQQQQKPATATATASAAASVPSVATQTNESVFAQNKALTNELDRLRSELKEMKFSLGSLMAQQIHQPVQAWDSFNNFDSLAETYDTPFNEIYLELLNTGISNEQARCIIEASMPLMSDNSVRSSKNLSQFCLTKVLPSLVNFSSDPLQSSQQTVMALVGPTGVGKTTTIAKLAARVALRQRRPVQLLTLDTYRIAAVDQLKTYAEIIGVGCHVARSVLELDSLIRRFAATSTVLIDTAGRGPNDLAEQMELADYLRTRRSIYKSLVISATTNTADAIVAAHKFSIFGVNRLVVTKLDETTRPGAVVGWASETKLPLLYLCAGQRVPEDLEIATTENCSARITRAQLPMAVAA